MKISSAIILTLIQFLALGQPNEWDIESIKRNKVKEVRIVVEVPKTNPAHPLMLWRQASFDTQGRLLESNCKHCLYQSHRPEGSIADLIRKYTYDNGRLAKIDEKGFEQSVVSIAYDTLKSRVLETTVDDKGQRTSLEIRYLDEKGRNLLAWKIEFGVGYEFDDSIAQVFFDKTEWQYHKQEFFTQTYNSDELVNMGSHISKNDFAIFQTSFDIDEIETIIKRTDLSFLKPWRRVRTQKNKDKIFQHNVDSKTGTTYFLGHTGLIEKEEKLIGDKLKTFIYQYSYYN